MQHYTPELIAYLHKVSPQKVVAFLYENEYFGDVTFFLDGEMYKQCHYDAIKWLSRESGTFYVEITDDGAAVSDEQINCELCS